METDQPAQENPDQATSDEQGASPARSYECTFCKRGFSNAQALGGHMNIHRKDKAKLKQTETTQQYSSDVPKNIPSYSPNHPSCTPVLQPMAADVRSSQARSSPGKWPWVFPNDDDDAIKRGKTSCHGGEIRQLTLFDEKPSITDQNPSSTHVQEGIEKGLSSSQGSSGSDQLDLELRLGPEPQDSSPGMTTKKFF